MPAKPTIAIVGAGRLGSALVPALLQARYKITEIAVRNSRESLRKGRNLAKTAKAHLHRLAEARLDADLIWFCVPDREIANIAAQVCGRGSWRGRIAFHSSGALPSDELSEIRKCGASVASVHPLMTFVKGSSPAVAGVPFALEGDLAAVKVARKIAHDLGAEAFMIRKQDKSAYHAWGAFTSPLIVSALATAEQVARIGGISAVEARRKMLPIVRQTLENYTKLGAAGALSGPLVRGDTAIVRRHLIALKKLPEARDVYAALARSAVRYLPVKKRRELRAILKS